jgi:hypothetical protein
MTTAPQNKLSYSTKEDIFQIDIPKIILDGAEVKHNGKFLTDFLTKSKLEFITENKTKLLALNESSLLVENFKNGITVALGEKGKVILKSTFHTDTIETTLTDSFIEFLFDRDMRLIGTKKGKDITNADEAKGTTCLLLDIKNKNLFGYLKSGQLGVAKHGTKEITFTKDDVNIFSLWDFSSVAPKEKYFSPYPSSNIYLTSTSWNPEGVYPSTEIRIGTKNFKFTRGANLLIKKGNYFIVENYDIHGSAEDVRKFVKRITELDSQKSFYAIIIHDSGNVEDQNYKKTLKNFGFKVLADLGFRQAYIGYSFHGFISEQKDSHTLSFTFSPEIVNGLRTDQQIQKDGKDRTKFIAHGGGVINGQPYTNSLEALNLSYEKGFRLFELDIIKTSDGKFIAFHDWEAWARRCNFNGNIPVSSQEFLQHKIDGQYTPLDMEAINKWFKDHKDAILVTDKVNTPREFASQFVDKDRLMMELFSLDAVVEGIAVGIRSAMPSENVISQIPGDKIQFLKDLKIKNICISRRWIEHNTDFLLKLKENHINAYAFHVNFDRGKDETYMLLHEMDYVYGIYADDWRFR